MKENGFYYKISQGKLQSVMFLYTSTTGARVYKDRDDGRIFETGNIVYHDTKEKAWQEYIAQLDESIEGTQDRIIDILTERDDMVKERERAVRNLGSF